MSDKYYSAEQVICLAAYGSTLMPSDPTESDLRERIQKKWGEQILRYEPVEKVGGERKHPCVGGIPDNKRRGHRAVFQRT